MRVERAEVLPYRISVLICTWNRARSLERALEGLARQTLPPNEFEVIVVDNNSTDNTRATVERKQASSPFSLRYLFEPRTGKCSALNAGLAAAQSPIIACTDDDCVPNPNWLEAVLKAFGRPEVGLLGGPGLSVFPSEVEREPRRLFLGRRFLGDFAPYAEFTELAEKNLPLGLNLAFRRDVAQQVSFDTELGVYGTVHIGREETDFVRRAQALGFRVFYDPQAVVLHYVDGDRVTWPRIRDKAYNTGIGSVKERYPRHAASVPDRVALALQFGLELLYSALRMAAFSFSYRRRTVAAFRAAAARGKLAGLGMICAKQRPSGS